jgi:hypothetical protein
MKVFFDLVWEVQGTEFRQDFSSLNEVMVELELLHSKGYQAYGVVRTWEKDGSESVWWKKILNKDHVRAIPLINDGKHGTPCGFGDVGYLKRWLRERGV